MEIVLVGERYTRSKNVEVPKYKQSPALSLPNHVSRHFQKEILRDFNFSGGHPQFYGCTPKNASFITENGQNFT